MSRLPARLHGMIAALAFFPLLTLTSCAGNNTVTAPAATPALASQWVVGWGAPPENSLTTAENPGGMEQTFRFIVLPTIDGTQERVHFSNQYGASPITIGSARIAVVTTAPAVDNTTDRPLTFAGSTTVTIPAGQTVTSDQVNVSYSFGQKLAISVYVKGSFTPLTEHESQVTTNYASATGAGDTTTDALGASFPKSMTEWFLLTGVDVYGPYQGTVVLYGSSSIDGHGSNDGNTSAYPVLNTPVAGQDNDRPSDWLARSLVAAGYRLGVLNAGQIADPAAEDGITAGGTSQAGVDRFARDVANQPNVKAVVIYFGGVDLRYDCVTATQVEASLTNIVAQATAANIRVILATLPPSEYCLSSDASLLPSSANPWQGDLYPGPENPGSMQRRLLNTWIRTVGPTLPGVVAIADFDTALYDPTHPDFMQPNYISADTFHPNGAGYQAQSGAIPLNAILGQ